MEIEKVLSKISFNNYVVEKIDFRINHDFQEYEKIQLDMKFNSKIDVNMEEHSSVISLGCLVFNDYLNKNYPFQLLIQMRAFFDFESTLPQEEVVKLLEVNGIAIVFPYLRALISNITINSGMPPLIIPTINISSMLNQKNETKQEP